jgi:hypothetical protein
VAAARGHVQADIAKEVEVTVESLVSITLIEQRDNVAAAFFQQFLFDLVATRLHISLVFLSPVFRQNCFESSDRKKLRSM